MNSAIDKQLIYTTTKLINKTINGEEKHSTGFIYNFKTSNNHIVRAIITCKHCIENYATIEANFCLDNGNGAPIDNIPYKFHFSSDNSICIVKHPKDNVDLVAMIFSIDDKLFLKGTKQPFFLSLYKEVLPSGERIEKFSYIEDIIMIGYPQGIWDRYNNKPIVRKGITATPIKYDFNNEPEFLVDVATFHGSSGSPVYLHVPSAHIEENSFVIGSEELYLIGVFKGGWEEVTGETTTNKIVIDKKTIEAKVLLPINLGFVIKSSTIEEMNELIENRIKELEYN